jgi:polysaccharide export outer membrane protein
MNVRPYISVLLIGLATALLGGCATFVDLPPGTVKAIVSPVVEKQETSVPLAEPDPPPSMDYVIGINDVVSVNMNGGDFGSIVSTNVSTGGGLSQGSRVDGNGNIQLPYLGLVKAEGLTTTQLSQSISDKLMKYFNDPWVVVEMVAYRSKPLYFIGEGNSSTFYMDHPITLLEGVATVGGASSSVSAQSSNLKRAQLLRNNKIVPVDLYTLVSKGDTRHNIWLKPGDTIFVPDKRNMSVYVFGRNVAPQVIPTLNDGTLPLSRAMAMANPDFVRGDLSRVRIIRSLTNTTGELIIVDFEKTMRGEALPFSLQDGDLVFVPQGKLQSWNDAIADLLPSLQLINQMLQPYVQLKYLFGSNSTVW